MTAWPPDRIQRLRQALEEDTATFGARFGVSGRTVESWELRTENGRAPHRLILPLLDDVIAPVYWDRKRAKRPKANR